jgi:molybdate transport system substrate-binding protein
VLRRELKSLDGPRRLGDISAMRYFWIFATWLALSGQTRSAAAEVVTVAVAANFAGAIEPLAEAFRKETQSELQIIVGSTGKLYAQIREGAPYDILLAADRETPARLHREGLAEKPFTYAIGALVLWSKRANFVDQEGLVLRGDAFSHLALANPDLAPYGRAARQTLMHMGLWSRLSARVVLGENIGQAYQFVDSGNAELGFVALSQVMDPTRPTSGSYWRVPPSLYDPLAQDAVVLGHGNGRTSALAFAQRLRTKATCEILKTYGYACPRAAN